MSKPELAVVVTSPTDGVVRPGDLIQGYVEIRVVEGFTCNAVQAALQCRTVGKGNKVNLLIGKVNLYQGQVEPGNHRFPFTLTAPKGPFSYTGKIIEVQWFAYATIDISWAVDPVASSLLQLVPRESMSRSDPYFYGSAPTGKGKDKDPAALATATGEPPPPQSPWLWLIIVPVLGIVVMGGVGLIIASPFFLAVFSPFIIYFVVKAWLVRKAIGKPKVHVSHQVVCRGDIITVTVEFSPRKDLTFGQIYAELTCQELAVSGSGKNSSTYRENVYVHREAFRLIERADLAQVYRKASENSSGSESIRHAKAGGNYQMTAQIPIRSELPYSLSLPSNQITSKLELRIELEGSPNWKQDIPVTVRPGTAIG